MAQPIKTLVFLGSSRNAKPFWGGLPMRTGDRVLKFAKARIENMNAAGTPLEVQVIDPLEHKSLLSMETLDGNPTYYNTRDNSTLPQDLQDLIGKVEWADCYLIVCPEYNHTIPPALTHMMNMIGCSKYANKVSACVCYSGFPSPAGGARCAVALRPFLSELGCLPVSKQVVIPNAPGQITEDGAPQGEHQEGLVKLMDTMLEQMRWWAEATRAQRNK